MTTSQHDFAPARPKRRCGRWAVCCAWRCACCSAPPHRPPPRAGSTRSMRRRWPAFPSARAPGTSTSGTTSFPPPPPAAPSGLLKAFAGGSGTGASQGRVVNGALVATSYPPPPRPRRRPKRSASRWPNGNVKEFGIEPEPPVDPDRIPVTDAHRRGVYDPMTGSLLRVPGTGDPLSARGLPHRRRRSSTAACATSSSSISSAWKP